MVSLVGDGAMVAGFRMAIGKGGTYDWDDLSLNQSREWDKVKVER